METTARRNSRHSRRDRYLDSALELFAKHGFVGTTMDMIIASVGGSKATLYKHFPSKDALVAGLMDQVSTPVSRGTTGLGAEVPLRDALRTFGETVLRAVVSPRSILLLRVSLGEHGRFPELCTAVWDHGPAATYAQFREFVEVRAGRGELVVTDSQLAAEQFIAGIVGHVQLKIAMGQRGPLPDEEVAARVASATETFLARYTVGR